MESLRKRISQASPSTVVLGVVGVGVSFLLLRKLWKGVLQKSSQLAYDQVRLLHQINEARTTTNSIVYLTIDSTIRIKGDLYSLDFNLMTKIEKKEHGQALESKNPFLPPFQPGLHICELGEKHRLLFNKYSIYHNHVLLVTKEFEPQENTLTEADFRQVIVVQGALRGVFYYNSGAQSGASQKHKHIQLLPAESRSLPFVEIVQGWLSENQENPEINSREVIRHPNFNFVHGIRRLPALSDHNALAASYSAAYNELYKNLLKHEGISYNLIATDKFMLMVPRRKERAFEEVSVNSVGFAGSILFKNPEQYVQFQSIKPEAIIADISYGSQLELEQAMAEVAPSFPK